MLVEWFAAITAAFAGAGIGLICRHLSRGRLPGSIIPIFAAIGMFGFAVWSEYSWFERTRASLPNSVAVTSQIAEPSTYRPWTYLAPFTSRFIAVDQAAIRTNPNVPDQRMTEIMLFARLEPPNVLPVLLDCRSGRRADIVDGLTFDDNGAVINADWLELATDDPLLDAVCSVELAGQS